MIGKISVVINTFNEEENIKRVIESVGWADEIIVCDMYSEDDTAVVAKKMGAKILLHKNMGYVEPARNFAISKAEHEWVLVVDADEEIPETLADKIKEIVEKTDVVTHVEIPRKNIIFGQVMKASMWWPDYHVRLFKKGYVVWGDKIHSKPKVEGQGLKLPEEERWAIIHYHYTNISQYIDRMNRYTGIEARYLANSGYEFDWKDMIRKPLGEFLGRYFANRGFQDGLYGLALSLLQAISFLIVYLKVWEKQGFKKQEVVLSQVKDVVGEGGKELGYWFKYGNLSKDPLRAFLQRIKNKLI